MVLERSSLAPAGILAGRTALDSGPCRSPRGAAVSNPLARRHPFDWNSGA